MRYKMAALSKVGNPAHLLSYSSTKVNSTPVKQKSNKHKKPHAEEMLNLPLLHAVNLIQTKLEIIGEQVQIDTRKIIQIETLSVSYQHCFFTTQKTYTVTHKCFCSYWFPEYIPKITLKQFNEAYTTSPYKLPRGK